MIIKTELPVVANGRPSKYKTSRTIVATVPVSVDISEADCSELHPALSLNLALSGKNPRLDYVTRDGKLFLAEGRTDDLKQSPHLFEQPSTPFHLRKTHRIVEKRLDALRGRSFRREVYPAPHGRALALFQDIVPQPLQELRLDYLDEAEVQNQIETFEARCARLLVVGDRLYREVAEPCISVRRSMTDPFAMLLSPVALPYDGWLSQNRHTPPAFFRLDETVEASEFCRSMGGMNDPMLNFHKFQVEIHDTSCLSLNSLTATAYCCAEKLGKADLADRIGFERAAEIEEIKGVVGSCNERTAPEQLCDLLSALVYAHEQGETIFGSLEDFETARLNARLSDDREIVLRHRPLAPGRPNP